MGLNIKNEEAHRLAQELATMTGESLTAVVTRLLRTEIERIKRERKGSLAEELLELTEGSASLWKEPYKSMDHADLLYDEMGLPK